MVGVGGLGLFSMKGGWFQSPGEQELGWCGSVRGVGE